MILAQTKATGYSLGLPLWWPGNDSQLSTGWLQGISLTLTGGPYNVVLTRYRRVGKNLSLTFSVNSTLLCSLSTTLGTKPATYTLQGENPQFVSGYVTFYGDDSDIEELDLTGAQVCPKYITYISPATVSTPKLQLVNMVNGEPETTSVELSDLEVIDSPTVRGETSDKNAIFTVIAEPLLQPIQETSWVASINGGGGILYLPPGWVVASTAPAGAKLGRTAEESSCVDYLAQQINPNNFSIECPLSGVLDDRGNFSFQKVVCSRYNTEYENGGVGLAWNEFSTIHDAPVE